MRIKPLGITCIYNTGVNLIDRNNMEKTPIHVYPINDIKEHNTDTSQCWCEPSIEECGAVIVHNSLDQRESYEQGIRKPN